MHMFPATGAPSKYEDFKEIKWLFHWFSLYTEVILFSFVSVAYLKNSQTPALCRTFKIILSFLSKRDPPYTFAINLLIVESTLLL